MAEISMRMCFPVHSCSWLLFLLAFFLFFLENKYKYSVCICVGERERFYKPGPVVVTDVDVGWQRRTNLLYRYNMRARGSVYPRDREADFV